MTTRARLFKKLGNFSEAFSISKPRNPPRAHLRHIGCCGAVLTRRTCSPLAPAPPTATHTCGFINLAAAVSPRRMDYSESRTLRYTPEQMYEIVANVDQYQQFVPWCKKSRTMKTRNGEVRAELEIGFPPVVERYVSEITTIPNHQVKAVCTKGNLFSHLETVWRFSPCQTPDCCKVEFCVSFEFKSLLHSQLAGVFFDEVAKQMVSAFESRACCLYTNQNTNQNTNNANHPQVSSRRRSTA